MNNESKIISLINNDLLKAAGRKKWKKLLPEYFFEENKNNSIQLFTNTII